MSRDLKKTQESAAFQTELRASLGEVTPLRRANRVALRKATPAPIPEQLLADEAHALAQSREIDPNDWEAGVDVEAEQSYLRGGFPHSMLNQLRRGKWTIQGELDLHLHTVEEARCVLADFLGESLRRERRCVRIVHGKGLRSPKREPVLKNKVRKWLQRRDEVLAYCEPPPSGGGSGAVLVLLKSTIRRSATMGHRQRAVVRGKD